MPVSAAQKKAIEEIISALTGATSRRTKRRLAGMFLELVDRDSWPEYYEVIPQPRCINGVKANLSQNKYKNSLDVFEDLNLVFLNALYYNEEGSQISKDAETLKGILENEWRQRSVLPAPPSSPPPSAAQKVHATKDHNERAAASSAPAKPQPSSSKSQPQNLTPQSAMDVDPVPPTKPASKTEAMKTQSPQRPASPDMEVDVGGTPEPDAVPQGSVGDGENEEVVRQLEKGLPRWDGLADVGWAADIAPERMADIVVTLSKYRDTQGNKLAASLEAMPEETSVPDLSIHAPLSLTLVESRVRSGHYQSSQAFDKEMSQLFLKARRSYECGTESYGNVLVLQRFYQALTSSNPPSPPYSSTTRFASFPTGPGNTGYSDADTGTGITTTRMTTKDKVAVEEVQYKGWSVRIGDWVHLSNPDDASRPIIAQVFKCFASQDPQRKGQLGVSVCWYFRPEETLHPADRQFWEREVFKSSHFADHPLEDIIEKVACQFTARHVRGRPAPPFWYPGWPLYVCDSRYNDKERDKVFVKIKNWNSCIPEEVRKNKEYMPIAEFARPVFPRHLPSPFLSARKPVGPGGLLDAEEQDKDKDKAAEAEKPDSGGTGRPKRPKRAAVTKAEAERAAAKNLGMPAAASSQHASSPAAQTQSQLQLQSRTQSQVLAQAQAQQPVSAQNAYLQVMPPREDRSIVAAAGGVAALGNNATAEELSPELAKFFRCDPETKEVLWFGAPPVDIVHTLPPEHSHKYLAYLARQRKKVAAGQDEGGEAMDVDVDVNTNATVNGDGEHQVPKRRKMPPTATDTLEALLREHGLWSV
ncbi:hypothetical protein C8Q80DRAFT_101939 [Daedaleopsis nitida]|nr:hypothetical protein C8Q80DRAFT_101939 [Daedaleopsis nitida]